MTSFGKMWAPNFSPLPYTTQPPPEYAAGKWMGQPKTRVAPNAEFATEA